MAGDDHGGTSGVLPEPPNPSTDKAIIPNISDLCISEQTNIPDEDNFDVSTMEALTAMKMLAIGVQALADMTGDVPPTPPVGWASQQSIKDLRANASHHHRRTSSRPATPPSSVPSDDLKAPTFTRVEIGSPEAHLSEPTLVNANTRTQYDAIARKFFSKKPPPISIDDYLVRLHRYCPMSTAVYLAAGVYIHKISVVEKAVPVTTRTVHRLLLASLRVAMKALEDLSYPHQRFAGVGGVSEKELAKLEVSLCYLMNFELRVNNALLYEKTRALQHLRRAGPNALGTFRLKLPTMKNKSGSE